ncbi:TetR/AcrR family transcriptional regulator [Streptomyces sp. M19]
MAEKRMTRLPPQERRAQLVDIGRKLLADRSLDELSTDEVAQRAGISRGLLFHYFASKRDFHQAVVRAECERLLAASEPPPTDPPLDAREWFRACVTGFLRYVRANRTLYLALVRGRPRTTRPCRRSSTRPGTAGPAGAGVPPARRAAGAPAPELTARAWTVFAEEAVVGWPPRRPGEPDADAELSAFLEDSLVRLLGP